MNVTAHITYGNGHVGHVIDGGKELTARPEFKEKYAYLEEGDRVAFETEGGIVFAHATVTEVAKMTGYEFIANRFDGHRKYDSPSEFEAEMNGYYPKATVTAGDMFWVIWFSEVELP